MKKVDESIIQVIPWVKMMIEKEKIHLDFLLENNAPDEMIERSKQTLESLSESLKEYENYFGQFIEEK